MKNIEYWYCRANEDVRSYAIRTKTKREALRRYRERDSKLCFQHPPVKVNVRYYGGVFGVLDAAMSGVADEAERRATNDWYLANKIRDGDGGFSPPVG